MKRNAFEASTQQEGESFTAFAKRILDYDSSSGNFTWKESRNGRALKGRVAGTKDKDGYLHIRIAGKLYRAHRLAWVFIHSEIEKGMEIDHKNGRRADNRIDNLRVADDLLNAQNIRVANSRSRTGVLGVSTSGKKFRAFICVNGWRKALGTYNSSEDAHQAYLIAKRAMHAGNLL